MNANELRLRNLFIEKNSNKVIEVIGLEKDRIIFSGMFLDNRQAESIQLTEEWLIKLGFTENEFTTIFSRSDIHISYNDEIYPICQGLQYGNAIKYVHQLQNIYFALTGEELTIKQ